MHSYRKSLLTLLSDIPAEPIEPRFIMDVFEGLRHALEKRESKWVDVVGTLPIEKPFLSAEAVEQIKARLAARKDAVIRIPPAEAVVLGRAIEGEAPALSADLVYSERVEEVASEKAMPNQAHPSSPTWARLISPAAVRYQLLLLAVALFVVTRTDSIAGAFLRNLGAMFLG
jgi:hypothetical protein